MPQGKFFKIGYGIIIILLIVLLFTKVSFLLNPLVIMFNTLLIPFMLSGFFYYLLRPIVYYLSSKHMRKSLIILTIYVVVGGLGALFFILLGPNLQAQIENFVQNLPSMVGDFKNQITKIQNDGLLKDYFAKNHLDLSTQISNYVNQGLVWASNYVSSLFTVVTNIVIIVTTVPIIVYYMLKDGEKASTTFLNWVPQRYRSVIGDILVEIDAALSGFIFGRILICFMLGVMIYVGFLIIGLPYALLLASVAMVLNLIPYIGPVIGAIPCVIVAFTQSPAMALWVIVVVIIAQQIDGNLLSPHIYGKNMDLHPLTVVVLLLVAGEVAGIIGIVLAIPVYMVIKIIVLHVNRLFIFKYE